MGKALHAKLLQELQIFKYLQIFDSCTQEISYYKGHFENEFYFTVVDTPGLDDSEGRDNEIYENLRKMLEKENMKIKGIFILLSFQNKRFGKSEKFIINKIIDLVPLKNIWNYITIIVTNTYSGNDLDSKKEGYLKNLKELFEKEFIPNSIKKYLIAGRFDDIKIIFTDFNESNPSIKEASEIKDIMIQSSKIIPLFKKIKKIEEKKLKF